MNHKAWKNAALILVASTIIGVIFALPKFENLSSWWTSLGPSLADWWSWGVLTPLIVAVDRRLPIALGKFKQRFAAHLFLAIPGVLLYIYIDKFFLVVMGLGSFSEAASIKPVLEALHGGLLWSMLVYLLIAGAWQAIQSNQHYLSSQLNIERLEHNFSQARLNALRMQLDPHFLFNALNTISAQVSQHPRVARQMIHDLGELLRLSLEPDCRQQVSLSEELHFLGHYIAIQKIRFEDKLRVVIEVPDQALDAQVPSLVLQPLVENAVRHGISSLVDGGTITVRASIMSEYLYLTVEDDGVGLPIDWAASTKGLGISVTRERIEMLHPGSNAYLRISRGKEAGTRAEIKLPYFAIASGT